MAHLSARFIVLTFMNTFIGFYVHLDLTSHFQFYFSFNSFLVFLFLKMRQYNLVCISFCYFLVCYIILGQDLKKIIKFQIRTTAVACLVALEEALIQ